MELLGKGRATIRVRKKRRLFSLLGLVAIPVLYSVWAYWDRGLEFLNPGINLGQIREFGRNQDTGNLVAIEPWLEPADYSSGRRFSAKLDGYFAGAKARGWFGAKTIVVLPEYLGTFLVAENEKSDVYRSETMASAMGLIAVSNLHLTIAKAIRPPCPDRMQYAVLSFKAHEVAAEYDRCLSSLAKKYAVTVVGGSIVLPSPRIEKARLAAGSGPLQNVCPVYRPDGTAYPNLVRKCYPTREERGSMQPGREEDLPVFETPAGRLGVLICADSWFPSAIEALVKKGAQLVVSPTFGPQNKILGRPWMGYSGWPNPPDVIASDLGKITERQAMFKYGLAGRLSQHPGISGITACLSGKLWEVELDSLAICVDRGEAKATPQVRGSSLVNLWLPQRK